MGGLGDYRLIYLNTSLVGYNPNWSLVTFIFGVNVPSFNFNSFFKKKMNEAIMLTFQAWEYKGVFQQSDKKLLK